MSSPTSADTFENPMADDASETFDAEPRTGKMVPVVTPELQRRRDGPPMSWKDHERALREKLERLYASMDTDGDGKLTGNEIKSKLDMDDEVEDLMALAGKSLRNISEQLDANKDGTVSQEEFIKMLTKQGFEYNFDWMMEQIEFQRQDVESRRLNILTIEEGYDASTVEADAAKCNATLNPDSGKWERDLGQVFPVWALLFNMVRDANGDPTDKVTHETVEVVQRMWELDLSVDVRRTIDQREVIVLVGIPYVIMQREAEEMQMKLRLKDTRGTLEYSVEFHDRFADYVRHPKNKAGDIFKDPEKGAEPGNFVEKSYATVFNSTHQQQAVLHRLKNNGIDLDFRMQLLPLETLIKRMKRLISKRRPVRAFQLKELLTAAGGFRENCDKIMGDNVDILAEQVLADPFMTLYPPEQCNQDGNPKEQEAYAQMQIANTHLREYRFPPGAPGSQREHNYLRFPTGLPEIEYDHVQDLLDTLDGFCFPEVKEKKDKNGKIVVEGRPAGPGADEQYIESLELFFPVHNQEELSWLRNQWGSWHQLWTYNFRAKEMEGADTPCWNIMDDADPTAPYSEDAVYNVPTVVFGCLYQPLDEIRDYFGDDNAIYFSWLATYTKALGVAGIFGTITMIFQFWRPEFLRPENPDEENEGVDGNPLTLMYSIFMSIWSVVFLSVWRRKEAEHSFLWGSVGYEDSELPRPEFRGKLVVNPETGREDVVVSNYPLLLLKKSFSYVVILVCMLVTVGLAFQAMSLKNLAPKPCQPGEDSVVTHIFLGCGANPNPGEAAKKQIRLIPGEPEFDANCCYDRDDLCYVDNGCGGPIKDGGKFVDGANGVPGQSCSDDDAWMTRLTYAPNHTTVEEFCGPRQALSSSDKNFYKLLSAGCNLVVIQGAGFFYETIADRLNDMENFRTETEHSDGLITKNFLFQFVNNYFVLFYIAYARHIKIGDIPGKHCEKSCLKEIQMQMLVVFTAKTFGLQMVELSKPFIQKQIKVFTEFKHVKSIIDATEDSLNKASTLASETANKTASLALSEEMRAEMGLDDDAMEEARIREEKRERLATKRRKMAETSTSSDAAAEGQKVMDEFELQTHMVNYEEKGTFDDFNEMAIQYGYISLFSPSFPIAPLLAFINNLTEIRGDAWKLCKGFQRPQAAQAEDIGSWFAVLNLLGFIAVLTNATMIAFVGSQLARDEYEEASISNRVQIARMWVYAVVVEHSVMLTRVCILVFFPVYPDWIRDANDVLRFRYGEMKKLSRARREQLVEEYGDGASPTAVPQKSQPDTSGSSELARKLKGRKFRHADVDGNRRLTREEFVNEFGEEAAAQFDELDVNHDGVVDATEWARGVGVTMRENRGQRSRA